MIGLCDKRYKLDRKIEVEECLKLSINSFYEANLLRDGADGQTLWLNLFGNEIARVDFSINIKPSDNFIQLKYLIKNVNKVSYTVRLITTKCNFSGVRYWFICPAIKNNEPCCKRSGVLYKPYNSKYFACRFCYELTYQSKKFNY